jgi:hypothetical protein
MLLSWALSGVATSGISSAAAVVALRWSRCTGRLCEFKIPTSLVQRTISLRLGALVLACGFLFAAAAEALCLVRCPHHSLVHEAAAHEGAAQQAVHAAAPAGSHAPGEERAPAQDGHHADPCRCLSRCQTGCFADALSPVAGAVVPTETSSPRLAFQPALPELPPASYILPFATAPPAPA